MAQPLDGVQCMDEARDVGRQRLISLFRFLKEFDQIRNPIPARIEEQPWVLWLDELPDHPAIQVPTRPGGDWADRAADEGAAPGANKDVGTDAPPLTRGEEFILRVRRPDLTGPPPPPNSLVDWLERGWDDPFADVRIRPVLTRPRQPLGESGGRVTDAAGENDPVPVARFEDDPRRVADWERWLARRNAWAAAERPARQAMGVFERLYELHGRMQREGERLELVLGDGLLTWSLPVVNVHHPVLLQRAELRFDPAIPEFTIVEAEASPELYTPVLRLVAEVNPSNLTALRDELSAAGYHPLGGEETADFLRRLVQTLSARGLFVEEPHTGGLPASDAAPREGVSCPSDVSRFTGSSKPLDGPRPSSVRVSHSVDASSLMNSLRPSSFPQHPVITRRPVLFVRMRTLGFSRAIDRILEDLPSRDTLPPTLLRIVGAPGAAASTAGTEPSATRDASPDRAGERASHKVGYQVGDDLSDIHDLSDILFTKPWNKEQVAIADKLEKYGAVAVQGPPGTGKTHTIANLIGHLLAHGRSVLVTAHTTKALRVLRDQVAVPLRSLCVSVLDNSLESRRQLEDSVDHIVERLSNTNADRLEEEARQLASERRRILETLHTLRRQLLEARQAEYREIVVGDQSFTPSDAARWVAQYRERDGWIPGPVDPGAPLPLSVDEIIQLYRTNAVLTPQDERELKAGLPDLAALPSPDAFDRLVAKRTSPLTSGMPGAADAELAGELWFNPPGAEGDETLETLARELCEAGRKVLDAEPWLQAACAAGLRGGTYRRAWDRLLAQIETVQRLAADAQETLIRFNPRPAPVAQVRLEEQARILREIVQALGPNDVLGGLKAALHPSWRRLAGEVSVCSGMPRTGEEFQAVLTVVELELAREELRARWDYLVSRAGGPPVSSLGPECEETAAQWIPVIRQHLDWMNEQVRPRLDLLSAAGFDVDRFLAGQPPEPSAIGDLLRLARALVEALPPVLHARANAIALYRLDTTLAAILQALRPYAGAPVVDRLRAAVVAGDGVAYRAAYQHLSELKMLEDEARRREDLLARLEPEAPAWAAAVRARDGVHGRPEPPGDPAAAWLWRQLHDELDRRASVSVQELQDRIDRLTGRLNEVTTQLVERLAWAAQIRRTTPDQQQALMGWLHLHRRIGKGFSKRAAELRAEAVRAMVRAQSAVPVWIMPVNRVVDHFDPAATRFDVLIVDEASQSDVLALTALYMARQVVVVGDDEQVSPDAVGEEAERISALIGEYLEGIPNARLYDGRRSLYDIAVESFPSHVVLLEHFRCVPDVIQFSNMLSYNGRIRPLREASGVHLRPHVVPHRVAGYSDHKTNPEEAREVAALVAAMVRMPEYTGKSLGVISLVGEEQAILIDRILRQRLTPDTYERHRILCGTPPQFQGDERHVVILSLVDGPGDGPLAMRDDDRWKKRFNVAASRAKDQMWVVYSLDPARDLKPGDLRRRLIEYALDPGASRRALESEERRAESEFEKEVMRRLVEAGYRVRSQWPVGYYRIDLVVEGGGKRLAIECDGDRYHPLERLVDDMARQAVLERMGWRFVRVRGSEFFRDPERAMRPVFERLETMGIPPEGSGFAVTVAPGAADGLSAAGDRPGFSRFAHSPLTQRVIQLAADIRRGWEGQSPVSDVTAGEVLGTFGTVAGLEAPLTIEGLKPSEVQPASEAQPTPDVRTPPALPIRPETPAPSAAGTITPMPSPSTAAAGATESSDAVRNHPESGQTLVDWVKSTDPGLWFALAEWAKRNNIFEPWERNFLSDLGRYRANGWRISEHRARSAKRLYDEAVRRGFVTPS